MKYLLKYKILFVAAFCGSSICLLLYHFRIEAEVVSGNNVHYLAAEKYNLRILERKYFPLDSVTSPHTINYYQFYQRGGVDYFSFLNYDAQIIYIYKYSSSTIDSLIPVSNIVVAPHEQIQGYRVLNSDSIVLYDYWKNRVTLYVRSTNNIIHKTLGANNYDLHPFASTGSPIIYSESSTTLYLGGFISSESERTNSKLSNLLTSLDYGSGIVSHFFHYPQLYDDKNWGGYTGLRKVYYDYNDDTGDILASFAADHSLTILNPRTGSERKVAFGSASIKEIKSMPYDKFYYASLSALEIYYYYLKSPSYGPVIYDKYRERYYRIVEHPVDNPIKDVRTAYKPKSIIFMDKNFRLIGEVSLPDNIYDTNNYFVSQDGFFLRVRESDDNFLVFHSIGMEI